MIPDPFFSGDALAGAEPHETPFPGWSESWWADPAEARAATAVMRSPSAAVVRSELGGSALAEIVALEEDGVFSTGIRVQLTQEGLYSVVLVDQLDDSLCSSAPALVRGSAFTFMGSDALQLKSSSRTDAGEPVVGRVRSASLAPAGVGGEAAFLNLYVKLSSSGSGLAVVTPVRDGELLVDERVLLPIDANGRPLVHRTHEVGLAVGDEIRQAVRGTWFEALIELVDLAGCGPVSVEGVEVEWDLVTEGVEDRSFEEEELVLPSRTGSSFTFMGAEGELAQFGGSTSDLGAFLTALARTNSYAPGGIGGEAIFTNVYLTLQRDNTETLTLHLTPIVDGVELDSIELELAGVAGPVRAVHEIGLAIPYPSVADPQLFYAMRGEWIQLQLETVAALPDGRIVVDGVELEVEVVTEGKDASNED